MCLSVGVLLAFSLFSSFHTVLAIRPSTDKATVCFNCLYPERVPACVYNMVSYRYQDFNCIELFSVKHWFSGCSVILWCHREYKANRTRSCLKLLIFLSRPSVYEFAFHNYIVYILFHFT